MNSVFCSILIQSHYIGSKQIINKIISTRKIINLCDHNDMRFSLSSEVPEYVIRMWIQGIENR